MISLRRSMGTWTCGYGATLKHARWEFEISVAGEIRARLSGVRLYRGKSCSLRNPGVGIGDTGIQGMYATNPDCGFDPDG